MDKIAKALQIGTYLALFAEKKAQRKLEIAESKYSVYDEKIAKAREALKFANEDFLTCIRAETAYAELIAIK